MGNSDAKRRAKLRFDANRSASEIKVGQLKKDLKITESNMVVKS